MKQSPINFRDEAMPQEIIREWPPRCPHCGGEQCWEGDFMLSETGYLPDDTAIADDGLCQLFRCTECDCSNEYTDSNDGALIHLSTIHPFNDEDMEPETNHSDYAKRTFGFSE